MPKDPEKARDARLQKKYGITLAEYNVLLAEQKGGCAICGRPGVTRSLAVDHDHSWRYVKISYTKTPNILGTQWIARAVYASRGYSIPARKKAEASKVIKRLMLRASIRGLLCPHCNSGLRKYSDDPDRMIKAAEYLRKHCN